MLNDTGFPAQALLIGVTKICAEIGMFVLLIVVKEVMFPIPEFGSPIAELLFVQVYSVFATGEPTKIMSFVRVPLHLA